MESIKEVFLLPVSVFVFSLYEPNIMKFGSYKGSYILSNAILSFSGWVELKRE